MRQVKLYLSDSDNVSLVFISRKTVPVSISVMITGSTEM